jgi:hypothetical protein
MMTDIFAAIEGMLDKKDKIRYLKKLSEDTRSPVWVQRVALMEIEHLRRKSFVIPGKKS